MTGLKQSRTDHHGLTQHTDTASELPGLLERHEDPHDFEICEATKRWVRKLGSRTVDCGGNDFTSRQVQSVLLGRAEFGGSLQRVHEGTIH